MRDIKFRGIRVDNKEFAFGSFYKPTCFLDGVYISMETTCVNLYPDLDEESNEPINVSEQPPGISVGKFIQVNIETVGQYIESNDKNDIEIYEGDILANPKGEVGTVVFHDCKFCIKVIRKNKTIWHMPLEKGFLRNKEIIGNIHKR